MNNTMGSLLRKKTHISFCPQCNTKLSYSSILGKYNCKTCGYTELDLYGQMKELVEGDPSLSKVEMSLILDVSLREINQFITDGVLSNPYKDIP